ncbi:hypothetical protein POTOM_017168 [Populus tomentosa]|uniref:Nicastrin n=1 Tax=Populus tomentosa TaxID=118781 RepID=A0A8X7ZZY0_POPTO|nr:hypothetical protein POTOM_017168 [Populus tomentosa]
MATDLPCLLPFLLFLFISHFPLSFSGSVNSMESVPDLTKSMYVDFDGYPCVRLLNLTGEIGCSNPGRDKVVAPVVRYKNVNEFSKPSAVLASLDEFLELVGRLGKSEILFEVLRGVEISNDSSIAKNIGGVLVEQGMDTQIKLKGFSPDQKFPGAEYAPYKSINYEWNPTGSGMMWRAYSFPVFLLTEGGAQLVQEVAMNNEKKRNDYTADVVEFDSVMQTTKSGTHDSESCLQEQTCFPLGGYSVWSSLPPINNSSTNHSKPIILTVASMDSASFFRDKNLGAESPISGLIALLAAVDSLSHVNGLDDLGKQLVFSVFTGEAWGYLGSRRFLFELDLQSEAVNGLNSSLIETVIEIGSVGKGFSQGNSTFFAHTAAVELVNYNIGGTPAYTPAGKRLLAQKGGHSHNTNILGPLILWGPQTIGSDLQVSLATNETLNALKHARDSLENITVSSASTLNPGIPPSSLMAFLKKNPSTSGMVLEDFDTSFSDKFYHSHLDDMSNINSSAIVAAASLVARTLYILASDDKNISSTALDAINVNASLVEELMSCLLDCEPGLSCELVKSYIVPTNQCPNHYVGVILGEPSSNPYLGYVDDVSRFIWNFLADRTSSSMEDASSDCSKECSNKGGVCIKAEVDGKGVCTISTTRGHYLAPTDSTWKFPSMASSTTISTYKIKMLWKMNYTLHGIYFRYVPAYSTRLNYESGTWRVLPSDSSDPMGMVDPVWTESNWDTIRLRVYTVQDAAFDRLVLLAGITITVMAYLAIVLTRAYIAKALKRD